MTQTHRIHELEQNIVKASENYYLGEPIMSDEEFDEVVEELRKISPEHPVLTKVGWGLSVYADKVKLPAPIRHSLDKVTGYENLNPDTIYRCSLKIDGMTCILQYVRGELVLAATRGDGFHGVNITPKMERITGVPMRLTDPIDIIVRGELFISLPEFEEKLSEENATPRASVSGIINRKSFDGLEHVRFVAHPETFSSTNISVIDFSVVPEFFMRPAQFEEYYKKNIYYPTDGMVCSGDKFEEIFAFKFKTEKVTTQVSHVEWNIKKGGKLCPVVHYNPVKLYDTICKKCSGHNFEYIKENGIGIGTTIELTKANEIIPYITKVVSGGEVPDLPEVDYKVDGAHAYVIEDIQYELSLKYFIEHHFCFDGFKRPEVIINALGINTFKDLADWRNPAYYSVIVDKLDEYGIKSLGVNITDKLTEGKLNEKDFFKQFGFDGLGNKASEALQPHINKYEEYLHERHVKENPDSDILLRGVMNETNVNITVRNILEDEMYQAIFGEARHHFEWELRDTAPVVDEGDVKGTFIITGSLPSGRSKKAFAEFVSQYGWQPVTTVNKADVVIGNPTSNTGKAKQAKDKGKPLLAEEQFFERECING